jgi:hypothetical protein
MTPTPTNGELIARLYELAERVRRVPDHRRAHLLALLDRLDRLVPDDTDADPMDMVR